MFRPGIPLPGTDAEGDQPRPVEDARQPTAAERVRTLVQSSVSASLTIPGTDVPQATPDPLGAGNPEARAVTPEGDVLLLVPAASPAARAAAYAQDDDVTAVMEVTDVAPVAVPHRVRGRAWVAGWLTPVRNGDRPKCERLIAEQCPEQPAPDVPWMLLRLEVGEAYVDDLWGEEQVEPEEFAAAEPDPLARHEAELLQHLSAAHDGQVRSLCSLLGDEDAVCGVRDQVVPLALDRHGMRVRFCGRAQCFDARFEFPEPVGDVAQLRRAMHALFEAAAEEG
ncbi:DUF2470 domain-containing protein [Streptomyces sp. ODS28]|uniref:DUF2470 domain-containing protein n=1 Tax=Streptomyces sp. ODS28 TaxID=3136688 RepID=UPI0031EF8E0C